MDKQDTIKAIESGKTYLGIEFGSTIIKAVLINELHEPIAEGNYFWENKNINNIWTYEIDDIWQGLQECYSDLRENVQTQFGVTIRTVSAIGISAMMHGYFAFDSGMNLLMPFRTWRNAITAEAASRLTALFKYNIPQRWSVAHLYQCILDREEHVHHIAHLETLASYVHRMLTGESVIGIGDASGMFPIDAQTKTYDKTMINAFNELDEVKAYSLKLEHLLPRVLTAGEHAGCLTAEGARLLDVSGNLQAGISFCPPEGDGITGMVSTNTVRTGTANVSVGTSIFAMIVLGQELQGVYPEIDLNMTPTGKLVANVHCNDCTTELNQWVDLFTDFLTLTGTQLDKNQIYTTLFNQALEGDPDCGNLLSYCFFSGEPMVHLEDAFPMIVKLHDSNFNLPNMMRSLLYTSFAGIAVGVNLLKEHENIQLVKLMAHGGLFKTPVVAQKLLASAMKVPVTVMKTASNGGAWGIAVLASYCKSREDISFEDWLDKYPFDSSEGVTIQPDPIDVEGFDRFLERYVHFLPVQNSLANLAKE